jgi:succinate dehydrogenase / fumarate reductase, membrane anchor subunit
MNSKSPLATPLSKVRGLGAAKSGTTHFWQQRLTALANVPLAVAFIVIIILLTGRDHAGALALLANPFVALLMLLFVISGAIHMRLGMQEIINDYVPGEAAKTVATIANTFFAIAIAGACVFSLLKIAL